MVEDAVELADLIWELRRELSRAMWSGEHADLRFRADQVQLELTVGVEKVREPGAKVRFWVFEAGATGRRAATVTQKITLVLQPVRADSPADAALIAGDELPNEE